LYIVILVYLYKLLKKNKISDITLTPIIFISLSILYNLADLYLLLKLKGFFDLTQSQAISISTIGMVFFSILNLIGTIKLSIYLKKNKALAVLNKLINRTGKTFIYSYIAQFTLTGVVAFLCTLQFDENTNSFAFDIINSFVLNKQKISITIELIPLSFIGKVFYFSLKSNNTLSDNQSEILDLQNE
jgi:hypothetical protein